MFTQTLGGAAQWCGVASQQKGSWLDSRLNEKINHDQNYFINPNREIHISVIDDFKIKCECGRLFVPFVSIWHIVMDQ